ncbi:MAG: type II toxin-antitoxin system prevent-host-death family antitoxin [Pseudomonadota bacterium]|jgi:prevent-host-death family protein|nr:type II toxin-antitoxin system prevent-host-death family antitoxin [Pseudomonadota bacterium]
MKQQISLREANQHLSSYIKAVEHGDEVIITRRGKPVAKLVRVSENQMLTSEQQAALKFLQETRWPLEHYQFNRAALYEERLEKLAGRTKGQS